MSKPKFTPGPWEAFNGYMVRKCVGDYCAPICDLQSPYRRGVGIYRGGSEQDANSHLIAAAPTGYELIARAVADRIDDEWLKDARAYLEAANGNLAAAKAQGGAR